ncbi:MAG: hypothetical protein BME93_03460 [Methanosarcinales archaeon Met12]|nr:MAG: hypothetical protein BME93_03460 [Methanosarcinales archaeon Met12]
MPNYNQGRTQITRDGNPIISILEIDFENGLQIYVFPGQLSPNDIWIKFRNFNTPRSQIRTPKHIHWTVDILIKKFGDSNLTNEFLNNMIARWEQITPLPDRTMQTIRNNLVKSRDNQFITHYQDLNNHGFFDIEFLTHLMELLMLQEKTNNPNAFMFIGVVDKLLNSNDLYSILSKAGFGGRR